MLGSSLAVGAVCCARHHLAFTPLRAVLRELFTISVCVALCGPALFCAFIIPGQSSCCLPPVIVMQPRVWRVVFASGGCCPCQRRKVRPQAMHPSLHYFVFMSTCLPCLLVRRFPSECRPSPLPPLPTASTTTATASTYRRYRQHYRCYRRRRRSDRCCRPPGRHCRLRHYRRSCAAGSTAALPLPTSPTVVSSAIVAVPPSPLPYAGMS